MAITIEHVVYINLAKRTDRREHMERVLDEFGWTELSHRFEAIPYPDFGIWGCGMSHLAVLKMARDANWDHVLILEDDFIPVVSKQEIESQMLTLPENLDVCMFAYQMNASEPFNDVFQRVLYAQTASAYLVKSHYYQKLIDLYEEAMPPLLSSRMHWVYCNDVIWKSLQERDVWLAPVQRWGKQMDGYSDNSMCFQTREH